MGKRKPLTLDKALATLESSQVDGEIGASKLAKGNQRSNKESKPAIKKVTPPSKAELARAKR